MLRAQGIDVLTTLEAGALGQPDPHQLETAIAAGRALVTHNRLDFEQLHAQFMTEARSHYGILIAPQPRDLTVTRDHLIDLLNHFDRDQLRDSLFYI
jgi:uncharacterized protein DUF5615